MTSTIRLTQGRVALIDDTDLPFVMPYSWYAERSRRRIGQEIWYARADIDGRKIRLHQFLLPGIEAPLEIDHINGDGLDNRRQNLRVVTRAQNLVNQQKLPGKSSPYKGVYWDKARQKWSAYMQAHGRMVALGRFDDPHEAARVRDAAVARVWGDYARLNGKAS